MPQSSVTTAECVLVAGRDELSEWADDEAGNYGSDDFQMVLKDNS